MKISANYVSLFLLSGIFVAGAPHSRAAPKRPAAVPVTGFRAIKQPYTVGVNALKQGYYRLTVSSGADRVDFENDTVVPRGGLEFGVYFTKGAVVTVGKQSYLVAYRPEARLDPRNFDRAGVDGVSGEPALERKLSPKASLVLSLLNLRTTVGLNDIRKFDPKLDVLTQAEAITLVNETLHQLGAQVLDHLGDEPKYPMPKMTADMTETTRRRLGYWESEANLWFSPLDGKSFLVNPNLTYKYLNRIGNPASLPLLYEATPSLDGKRGVVFLDGHVSRVAESQWSAMLKTQVLLKPKPVAPKPTPKQAPSPRADSPG